MSLIWNEMALSTEEIVNFPHLFTGISTPFSYQHSSEPSSFSMVDSKKGSSVNLFQISLETFS